MSTKNKEKFNLSDLFTLPIAQAGRHLKLVMPDGSPTDYHLTVIGSDAPAARKALLASSRIIRDETNDKTSDEDRLAVTERAALAFRVELVTGWNLPIEFSKEAVTELLTNNPGLAQEVESFSGDRQRFFGSKLIA